MARTKEFDPDVVLQRAMDLFWERGYEATSMADLVEHLGIGRASLYGTFGSKHDLYLAAMRRYLRGSEAGFVTALAQPGPALPAVRAFVESWVTEALTDPNRRGCLVVNAAVELSPRDPEVARQVEVSWSVVETALVSSLLRAQAQGELAADKDPHEIAHFLLVVMQGVRVIARAAPEAERLRAAARLALAALD
ncbi:TetR family transcriptional regulator [Streptomyces sp. TRM43335]|uniref:TetR family transcriptional regulator n=1 Tax=Streptomyces taklimakanensis TaxID=2569853 RepID=A0A6G2B731_9ACTN|nr:TetR/AcrR family transcriptional regulator [Streptomyces taklimakanensis]MTE18085.1 TetR family transcriptional regulator [Streptomyces taklimakanensis]